jgi:hypothetical protein
MDDSFAADRRHWSAEINLAPHINGVETDGTPSLLRGGQIDFGLCPQRFSQLKMQRRDERTEVQSFRRLVLFA